MSSNGLEIKKETFIKLDQEGKSEVLYDYLDHIVRELQHLKRMRETSLKKSMTISAITGFIGGFFAAFANLFK